MYARTVTIQLQSGKTEETIQIYRDSVLSEAKKQKGFKGVLLLTNPENDTGMFVTLWETEADLKAGEASGYFQEQLVKFAQVFASPARRDAYQVGLLEV